MSPQNSSSPPFMPPTIALPLLSAVINKEARATIRRLLVQPNVLDDVPTLTEQLVLAAQSTKQEDEQRIRLLFDDTVDRNQLWREIEKNLTLFNKETKFEGGFTLEPLINGGQKAENFDLGKFAKHIKDIRNALSHGRDIRIRGRDAGDVAPVLVLVVAVELLPRQHRGGVQPAAHPLTTPS